MSSSKQIQSLQKELDACKLVINELLMQIKELTDRLATKNSNENSTSHVG